VGCARYLLCFYRALGGGAGVGDLGGRLGLPEGSRKGAAHTRQCNCTAKPPSKSQHPQTRAHTSRPTCIHGGHYCGESTHLGPSSRTPQAGRQPLDLRTGRSQAGGHRAGFACRASPQRWGQQGAHAGAHTKVRGGRNGWRGGEKKNITKPGWGCGEAQGERVELWLGGWVGGATSMERSPPTGGRGRDPGRGIPVRRFRSQATARTCRGSAGSPSDPSRSSGTPAPPLQPG
jgi:hypothetical protein